MQISRLSLGLGFITAVVGLAFLIAGTHNLSKVPILEVREIGTSLLIIGIIVMLISVIVVLRS